MIPVIDAHNDALLRVWRSGESLRDRSEDGHLDLPRMQEGGIAAGFFAIFVPEDDNAGDPRANVVETEDGWEVAFPEPLEAGRGAAVAHEIVAIAERDLSVIRTVSSISARANVRGDLPGILRVIAASDSSAIIPETVTPSTVTTTPVA